MKPLRRFDAFQFDVLREIGNIGAGHAATAMSIMLGKRTQMQVPQANMFSFGEIAKIVGGEDKVVVTVYLRVEGDAPAHIFFMMQPDSARTLLVHFAGLGIDGDESFTELEISALAEIGNILAGSYLSSLADFTKLNLVPTVPGLAMDMAGAVLDYGLMQYGLAGDSALLIETKFLEEHVEVDGHFLLIPDPDALPRIFDALGVSHP